MPKTKAPAKLSYASSERSAQTFSVACQSAAEYELISSTVAAIQPMLSQLDKERSLALAQSYLEASFGLQEGARKQAALRGERIAKALAKVVLVSAAELGAKIKSTSAKPESTVAQWVFRKQIFGIRLNNKGMFYPAFQFEPSSWKPYPELTQVLPLLLAAFEPIDLLLWFLAPNPALGNVEPANSIGVPGKLRAAYEASTASLEVW